jgi:hypothetical protein
MLVNITLEETGLASVAVGPTGVTWVEKIKQAEKCEFRHWAAPFMSPLFRMLTFDHHHRLHPRKPLSIDELISPLRYDILVRRDFLLFIRQHRSLYRRDFNTFLDEAMGHAYFDWFKHVLCGRRRPDLLDNPDALRAAFARRASAAESLLASVEQRGMDPSYPILLKTGFIVLPSKSGCRVSLPCYLGDGCHRLALMILDGWKELPPEYYRVAYYPVFRPLDNTSRLREHFDLYGERYIEFLSRGYADQVFAEQNSLLQDVRQHRPERHRELLDLINLTARSAESMAR